MQWAMEQATGEVHGHGGNNKSKSSRNRSKGSCGVLRTTKRASFLGVNVAGIPVAVVAVSSRVAAVTSVRVRVAQIHFAQILLRWNDITKSGKGHLKETPTIKRRD